MANFNSIKQEIDQNVNTNGQQLITGAILNETLKDMIDEVDSKKQDTLVAGSGINISGNVISATGGSGQTLSANPPLDINNDTIILNYGTGIKIGEGEALEADFDYVQEKLDSGVNIKTINGNSLLGSGDITISGGNGLWQSGSGTDSLVAPVSANAGLTASGDGALIAARGDSSATGRTSASFGLDNKATGDNSFAAGNHNEARGANSTVIGHGLYARNTDEVALGQYNSSHVSTSGQPWATKFSIGNGNSFINPSNVVEVRDNGKVFVNGIGGYAGSSSDNASNSLQEVVNGKQDTLVSGQNIKTINGNTILGSGDLVISGGQTYTAGDFINITSGVISVDSNNLAGNGLTTDSNGALEVDSSVVATQADLSGYLRNDDSGTIQNQDGTGDTSLTIIDGDSEDYVKLVAYDTPGVSPHIEIFENGSGDTKIYYDKIHSGNYDLNFPTLTQDETIATVSDLNTATSGLQPSLMAGNAIDASDLTNNDTISVNPTDLAGYGLYVDGNNQLSVQNDVFQEILSAGDGIEIDANNEISVKAGTGLGFDANGYLINTGGGGGGQTLSAGDGIEIDQNDAINAKLGSGLQLDQNNNIEIDPSVVATQSDLSGYATQTDLQGYLPLTGGNLQASNIATEVRVKSPSDDSYVYLHAVDTGSPTIKFHRDIQNPTNGEVHEITLHNERLDIERWDQSGNTWEADTLYFPQFKTGTIALDSDLAGKQDTLIAGQNITIQNNVISATGGGGGTTYTAGDGIDITNGTISVSLDPYTGLDFTSGDLTIDRPQLITNLAGNGLEADSNLQMQVKLGSGLQFDANGAIETTGGGGSGLWSSGTGTNSLLSPSAVASSATASGTGALNAGYYNGQSGSASFANGDYSANFGTNNKVSYANSFASGLSNTTGGHEAFVGGGASNLAGGDCSAVIGGTFGTASGDNSVVIASGANGTANGNHSVAIGNATASGYGAIAIGEESSTNANHAIAIAGAEATGVNSVAIGKKVGTNNENEIGLGFANKVYTSGTGSIKSAFTVGNGTFSNGNYTYSNGLELKGNSDFYVYGVGGFDGTNSYNGNNSGNRAKTLQEVLNDKQDTLTAGTGISISGNVISATGGSGLWTSGTGTNSLVGPDGGTASGSGSISLNGSATATNSTSMAGGWRSSATGWNGFAYGNQASAGGDASISLGDHTNANIACGIALGQYAQTGNKQQGSIALGKYNYVDTGNTATQNTTFSIGNGTGNNARSNALELTAGDKFYMTGVGSYTGANASSATSVQDVINGKQDTLTAGTGISISGNVISATGGGGGNYLPLTGGSLQQDPASYSSTQLLVESPSQYATVAIESVDLDPGNTAESLAKITLSDYDDQNNQHSVVYYSTGIGTGNYKISFPTPTQNDTFALLSDIQGGGGSGLWTSGTGTGSVMSPGATQANGNYSVSGGDGTRANGTGSVALGGNTTASGTYSTALGAGSSATNSYTVAIGHGVQAANQNETALGAFNLYTNSGTSAQKTFFTVGNGTGTNAKSNLIEAKENNDIYVVGVGNYDGTNAGSSGVHTLQYAIANAGGGGGSSLWTSGTGTDSLVAPATITAGLAVDPAPGTGAISCGYDTDANGDYSFAQGGASTADGDYSFAANNGTAGGDYSAAFGTSGASGDRSFAAGDGSTADAAYSVALGGGSVVYDDSDPDNIIDAQYGVAVGHGARSLGQYAAAFGTAAAATGNSSVGLGSNSSAEGAESLAMPYAFSVGDFSLAGGSGSTANAYGSIAIGHGAMTYDGYADPTDPTDPNAFETALGKFNYTEADIAFSIGCGYEDLTDPNFPQEVRQNAITITNDGKIYLKGLGGYTGTSVSGCTDLVSFLNNL